MIQATRLAVLSIASALLILCCSVISLAQNREKYVISAKAGGINAVTGEARVHGKGESEWQQLMITDDLNAGDRVRTADDAFAAPRRETLSILRTLPISLPFGGVAYPVVRRRSHVDGRRDRGSQRRFRRPEGHDVQAVT